jgi:hypothetical protein
VVHCIDALARRPPPVRGFHLVDADHLEETNVPITGLTRALPVLAVVAGLGAVLAPAATAAPATDLTISVSDPFGPAVREYHLTCDPDGGTHPAAKAACAAIRESPGAVKPVPPTAHCMDQVYGPEQAKVVGRLFGVDVAAAFNRRDSCEEDRWQAWFPVWG